MKIKIILYTCLSLLIFSSTGCSDDDNKAVEFDKNIVLDINDIEIDPGKESSVKITDGNGSYTVKSTDETIASATVDGANVKVIAHKSGIASLIITDGKGVNSVVKVLVYSELELEVASIMIFANRSAKVHISSGNDGYRAESLSKSLDTRIETDDKGISYLVINSSDEELENAVVTVYDRTMRSTTINVTVKDPYIKIKEDATERVQYRAHEKTVGTPGITFYNSISRNPGYRTFGWDEGGYREFEIRIPTSIDLKVIGQKAGAQIKYMLFGYGDIYIWDWVNIDLNPGLEVIKYDSTTGLVWIVFYYTDTDPESSKTSQGIACMKI